jgi:hypothetical protein
MEQQRSLEYQLRAAEQRLAGIDLSLRERWTFAAVSDRHDTEREIARLQRAIRKEQHLARLAAAQQPDLPFEQTHHQGELA